MDAFWVKLLSSLAQRTGNSMSDLTRLDIQDFFHLLDTVQSEKPNRSGK